MRKNDPTRPCFTSEVVTRNGLLLRNAHTEYKKLVSDMDKYKRTSSKLIRRLTEESKGDPSRKDQKLRLGAKSLNKYPTHVYIRKAFAKVRKPMTIHEIVEAIEELGWTTKNPQNRYGAVAGALRAPENVPVFPRVKPGVYSYNAARYQRYKSASAA